MSCVEWSKCKDDEHKVEKATSKSDTVCDSTTECGDDEYEYRAPRAGQTNRQCKAITQCDDGEYISTPAKYNRNQRCRRCDKSTASYDGGCTSTTRTTSTRTSTTRTRSTTTTTTRTRSTRTTTAVTTSTTSTTTTTQTLTTTTSTLDKRALDALGKSLLDVIAQEQEQGIDEEDQVNNLLTRGYSLYEVMESEVYTFDEIVGAGITRSKAEATQASISSAGQSGTGGGDGSTTTAIAIVVVIMILAIGGAVIYVNKARTKGDVGGNFENPMFGAGVDFGIDNHSGLNNPMYEDASGGRNGTAGYMDMPVGTVDSTSGYMDVSPGGNAGGSQGYMDVSGETGPQQSGFEDAMASQMAQMEAEMGGFDGGEGDGGEEI